MTRLVSAEVILRRMKKIMNPTLQVIVMFSMVNSTPKSGSTVDISGESIIPSNMTTTTTSVT
jgi:hypothetical protein